MKTKKQETASAIIRTIIYSDIFDYPLTLEEIVKFLVGESEVGMGVVLNSLTKIIADPSAGSGQVSKQIYTDGEFYFLKGRKEIIELRKRRMGWSEKKWKIARGTAKKLRVIPMIKMVGITGALAMKNCKETDDIDLMVITVADRLWLTRLILYVLAPILGIRRRKPKEREVEDKICFNLFLEESSLQIQPENLFFAHEICQVKPIFWKDNIYEKFLWENQWVSNFLPNAKNSLKFKVQSSKLGKKHPISQSASWRILISFFNTLAFKLQYLYMKPKMSIEKISLHQAFFHPVNLQEKICASFEEKLREIKRA